MTKEEYIESLVSQNLTGKEIVKLAAKFGQEEKQSEEEVKTDDVATQDANVTSTRNEASNTTSESSDGQSDYGITLDEFVKSDAIQQKAIAKGLGLTTEELSKKLEEQEAVVKKAKEKEKEREKRINSLYDKYNGPSHTTYKVDDAWTYGEVNMTRKAEWLDKNVNIPTDEDIESKKSQEGGVLNYITGDMDVWDLFENEAEKAQAIQDDQDLKDFKFNQANIKYNEDVKAISGDENLSEEERNIKLNELKPPPLTTIEDVESEVLDVSEEFEGLINTLGGKDATLEMFNGNQLKLDKYNEYVGLYDLYTDVMDSKGKGYNFNNELAKEYEKRYGKLTYEGAGKNPKMDDPEFRSDKKRSLNPEYQTLTKNQLMELSLRKKQREISAAFNEEQDAQADFIEEGSEGLRRFSGGWYGKDKRVKMLKETKVNPTAVRMTQDLFPENASAITSDADIDEAFTQGYSKLVNEDPVINAFYDSIKKVAEPLIEKKREELLKTEDLTTPEGVAAATKKLEEYARSITSDKLENSELYKNRVTELGLVASASMEKVNKAWARKQDTFLSRLDAFRGGENDGIPFNDTIADFVESFSAGSIGIYNSFQKAGVSLEGKGVRDIKRKIADIDERVASGEITEEEGKRLKTEKRLVGTSLVEELVNDQKDVAQLVDSINEIDEYVGLFETADLADGDISFRDVVLTVGQALPQITIAGVTAAAAVGTGGAAAPLLAGVGTAVMFTQMYGDNYWSAYQEGIKKDVRNLGLDWDSMSDEEKREFSLTALEEGRHADIAASAAFAGVMTYAERIGAGKVLKSTQKALGLGATGLASLYAGQFKQFGKSMLSGLLSKSYAGAAEFGTEFLQEALGQISTGLQSGDNALEYIDFAEQMNSGKAGGIVGFVLPFGASIATQTATEIRNMSRDVAIKFAPNSEYGKFSIESKKFFEDAQSNLDTQLKENKITQEQYQEDSANLSDTRNSSLKIDPNASQDIRTRQLDLMVKRNQLMRKIKNTDDSDLTQAEQAELKTVQQELQNVVAEQKLYSTSGNVRKIIQDSGPKDSQGNPMIEFKDFSTAKETQQEADNLERQGYTRAAASKAHGVQMINEATGKEVLLINNEVASGKAGLVGNVNVAAHEFLHSMLRKTLANNPEVAQEMRTNMDNYLSKINIENIDPNSKYGKTLALYKNDPSAVTNEEAMVLFADALANGDVELNEGALTKLKNVVRRIMQAVGLKNVEFKTGQDVVNFLKDYNNSIEKGKLNRAQKKLLGTEQSMKEDGTVAKESRARATVLEEINKLVPQDIKTKAEYDAFLANQRQSKPLFDALLKDGGVINNYVKSRSTTKAESDKAIESLTDRILNFNPEAKRADGKPVGIEGFGEAIFANTRFAKLDAKKALFKEGEKAKQQKSIDGGTLQIADESTTSKKDDTKLAKKPTQTTGFDKATETKIDEAVNKNFKGPDVKFSQTKNVPKDVAVIYGEELGLNPQTITDKTRNYSKKDAAGLTKAKQFLLKNAKDDYARLPQLKDDFGKGTFVPKNVKDALYTDGKLTGSLKDYMDLIREKPVKPIYRDRVGQTIRGLLNLAIRNRMLETAQPSQAKRLQSGAKFSRAIPKFQVTGQDGVVQMRDSAKAFAKANNVVIEFEGETINIDNLNAKNPIHRKYIQNSIETELWKYMPIESISASTVVDYSANQDRGFFLTKEEFAAVETKMKANKKKWLAEGNKLDYDVKAVKAAKAAKKPAKKEGFYTSEQFKEKLKLVDSGIKSILDGGANAIKADKSLYLPIFALSSTQSQSSSHVIRNMSVDVGVTKAYVIAKDGTVKEHVFPSNEMAPLMYDSMLFDAVDVLMPVIRDTYYQIGITQIQDNKMIGPGYNYKTTQTKEFNDKLKEYFKTGDTSLIPSPLLRYFNPFVNQNMLDGTPGFNSNEMLVKGSTVASQYTMELTPSQQNPDILFYQNELTYLVLNGTIDQATAVANLTAALPVNKIKAKQGKSLVKEFGPKLSENSTADQKIKVLNDYDRTSKLSRALNTPKKGISVFDFDDTLAKTKEKVIVNKADGTTVSISASEFAKTAVKLEEDGAQFDFSEFENVSKGTQKGPLADLALKRQEKFGSKDIFVLTARPQIAADGIKKFLDGIGLSIPLANITGLENGSPQAKAAWVVEKTAKGYNDFYFADDAIKNVKAVKEILDQVDVKSDVQLAKASKALTFDKIINNILEDSTGIKSEAEFSKARAQTIGGKKGKFSFFTTPSAEDFVGLIYKFLGKGKVGDAQFQFFQDNLIDPYNRAEQAVTRAKISAANDFKALKKSLKTLPKSLSKQTGIGGFTFGQAARVAVWTRQGMEVPGLSKRDAKQLNDFVENNSELNVFADELILIQKGKPYPAPGQNWLAGNITSDIVNEINKVNRKEYMQEFNENVDIIFSDKVMNKLEAAYGPRYVEALRDMLRRMKSGSNRPVGNSRIVDGLLNWLNNSVGAIMFLNTRSAVLQTISAVNFINFGNNNLIAAGKAFANQKQYWKDFMTLFNSPYLVERRDGLKINVSESEIADAVSESSNKPKAFLNLLLSKGFILTRIADSFAIAAGGSTFYRNQIKAYMKSGMDQKAAEKQAFDDFYAIAETSQQSSNPSKISQQQASGAGRVILAFANTPMQYARIIKRASQDLIAGRGDWKTNVSKIVYYAAMQNLIFNALQTALFSMAFDEEGEEEKEDKTGRIANGMADSLLRGLGIQGAAVAAIKDALFTIYEQANKEKGAPEFRKAISDLFGFSPPLDSKIRKLTSGANTFSWEREKMSQEGFNLNNPAYLAFAQVLAGLTNVPLDRAIQKINNLRAVTSDSSAKWQKVALLMGWSTWDLGLPYYGVEDKEVQTPQTILRDKVNKMKKETSAKQQKETLLELGLSKQQIKALKYEDARIKKIIELQKLKK